MVTDLDDIPAALALLRAAPNGLDVFGARGHHYELDPPLAEAEVQTFETAHRIELPKEYRQFLLRVGNGGAGPYYGLFPLGRMDDAWKDKRWHENNGFIGTLSEPFPHTAAWNAWPFEPTQDVPDEELDKAEPVYWDPKNVNGAIPICHLGCAIRQWLVVTGVEAGNVRRDDRPDYHGLYPLQRGGSTRVSFLQWYLDWLNEAMRQCLGRESV